MPSYTQYKRQVAVLDDDNDIESWITVHGNHIPIKKGQSKEDAVKSFIESKGGNTAKGSNQKSELGIIYHKDKGHIKEGRPPKDWTKVEGGTTAPNGYSWYSNNKSNNSTHKTGIDVDTNASNKVKNIYDMAGNVYEWTMEACGTYYRVLRGGAYNNTGSYGPASLRGNDNPIYPNNYFGFRLALFMES